MRTTVKDYVASRINRLYFVKTKLYSTEDITIVLKKAKFYYDRTFVSFVLRNCFKRIGIDQYQFYPFSDLVNAMEKSVKEYRKAVWDTHRPRKKKTVLEEDICIAEILEESALEQQIEDAIALLKRHDYKIYKPVITYIEV